MKTLLLIGGIPGSGKSRYCRAYKEKHPNTFIIDCDETRKKLTGSYLVFPSHMEIIYDDMVKEANDILASHTSEEDITVIEDGSFLDNYRRKYFMDRIVGYDKAVLLLIKMHDYSICYEYNRCRQKDKWVPDDVIDAMIKRYEDPTEEVSKMFDEVKIEYWDFKNDIKSKKA